MRAAASTLCILAGLCVQSAYAAEAAWPQFRGPESNPVSASSGLPDRWSTTENVEWVVDVPGRGWSSPVVVGDQIFVTAAVTDGDSKEPQIGTEYSNEYVAELSKQGLDEAEVIPDLVRSDVFLHRDVDLLADATRLPVVDASLRAYGHSLAEGLRLARQGPVALGRWTRAIEQA